MKKLYITWLHTISKSILLIVLITSYSVTAQTFTDSNLPIIIITTDNDPNTGLPLEILDDPKVLASMKIINPVVLVFFAVPPRSIWGLA